MTNRNKHPDFGIYAAAVMSLDMFEIASRGTGRTTAVLEGLKADDLFLTFNPHHASQVQRELSDMHGIDVPIRVSHVTSMAGLYGRVETERKHGFRGRIVLDHTVVHALFREAIENTAKSIAHLTATAPAPRDIGSIELGREMRAVRKGLKG